MAGVAHSQLNIIVKMQVDAAKSQLMALQRIVGQMNFEKTMKNPTIEMGREFIKANKQANEFERTLGKNSEATKAAKQNVADMATQMKLNNSEIKKARLGTKGFSFDFLTLLFAGMMLTRTFGGMVKSIVSGYKKMMGNNSMFIKSTNKLSASWSYLKFAIASALDNPFIVNAVEWLTDTIEKIADYLAEHPGLSTTLLAVFGALWAFGSLAQIASGVMQLEMLFNIMSKATAGAAIGNMEKLGGLSTTSFTTIILGVTAVIAIFGALFALLLGDESTQKWVLNVIGGLTNLIVDVVALLLKGAVILANGLDLLLNQFIDSLELFGKLTFETIGSSGISIIVKAYRGWLRLTNQITDAQEHQIDVLLEQIDTAKKKNIELAKTEFVEDSIGNLDKMFANVDETINKIDFNKEDIQNKVTETLSAVSNGLTILKDRQKEVAEATTNNNVAQEELITLVDTISNTTLPNNNDAIDVNNTKLKNQAEAYNTARRAIERYNSELEKSRSKNSNSNRSVTRSTSTRT